MTNDELAGLVRHLDQQHRRDWDGGYALIREISAFAKSLGPEDLRRLREVLLELVAAEDPTLWGVALEVLVQDGSPESALRLARLLESGPHSLQWQDQVIGGLLRLRYTPAIDRFTAHIRAGLSQGRRNVLSLLAALVRVAPDSAIELAANFFAEQLPKEANLTSIEGYIPAFVRYYVEENDLLIERLLNRTYNADPKAGSLLSSMLRNYLSKPWLAAELGKERVINLQRELSRGDSEA